MFHDDDTTYNIAFLRLAMLSIHRDLEVQTDEFINGLANRKKEENLSVNNIIFNS